MEVLNKRERKLFKVIKKEFVKNKHYKVETKDMSEYKSLLAKLKSSGHVHVVYADNCAIITGMSNLKQFEIEEKEQRKSNAKDNVSKYIIAIVSSLVGAISGALLTYFLTK